MSARSTSLPPATHVKLALLADLLSQASAVAREISQTHPQLHLNLSVLDVGSSIPPDQAWYWTREWQAAEREVDEQLERGEYEEFDSMEEAIAHLHKQV